MKPKDTLTFHELQKLLIQANQQGGFEQTLLTDLQGLPIASSTMETDQSENQAAIVAMIQKLTGQINTSLNMSQTEEFVLYDQNGKKLVIRSFEANTTELILSVLIPNNQTAYRRLMSNVIKTIKLSWMY
jgi:predicted regulator of Ras-like GTPase activity (Roadblock/LC7/MglB family)